MANRYVYKADEHPGRVILGDPQAEAYAWIMAYAAQITERANDSDEQDYHSRNANYTAEDLIAIAESNKKDGWGDYICHGGAFEGESVDPLFWDKLSIVLDEEVPDEDRNGFFLAHADRGSGRSTRQAVAVLQKLLANPGKWVIVDDHFQNPLKSTIPDEAATILSRLLKDLHIQHQIRRRDDPSTWNRHIEFLVIPLPQHRIYKCKTPTQSPQGLCRKSSQP